MEADASAEEALGDGFHAVFPATVAVHGDVPVSGAAHGGEDKEEATFGDGAADRVAPIGHEEAVFDQFTWDEFFNTAGEVGDVAELAGFTNGQVGGEGGATPSAKECLSFGIGQLFRPRGGVGEG